MIYKKSLKGTEEVVEPISFEEAMEYAGTGKLVFDNQVEEMNFYQEVVKQYQQKYPQSSPSNKEKSSPLEEIVPYLDENDLYEVILSILNEGEESEYNNLNLEELFPYLNERHVDEVFAKVISGKECSVNPIELLPYVSEKALTIFVDEYLKGKYQDVDINEVYPYLNSKDIKRLFKYYLSKRNDSSL